jgi:DnaJ-domain-containing protein 1
VIEAYPLYWPEGQMRVPPSRRRSAKFSTGFARSRDELVEELRRMGARAVIVSTNIPLRRDGLPYADTRAPDDPAVAVYFTHGKRQLVIACDSYTKVEWNMRACGELLERAFTGFTALPPKGGEERPWFEVLGVPATASDEVIKAAYRSLAARHHPDVGGDAETMARINQAYDLATQRGAQ